MIFANRLINKKQSENTLKYFQTALKSWLIISVIVMYVIIYLILR